MQRWERGWERLSERSRERLVVENDDRTFSLAHVMELHRRTGVKVVWDILHHHCNDPDDVPDREALETALSTWPEGVTPKIHYSTPKTRWRSASARWAGAWSAAGCCRSCARTRT
jgi:UV DNA damage endonuclease